MDVTVRVVGGRRVAASLFGAAVEADRAVEDAVREAGEASVFVFRAKAPRRTGRLQRGIRSAASGNVAVVTAHARSNTGYDYVGVTRFGHRVRRIVAKGRALRITVGRRVIFRKSVRGYRPAGDWARRADPAVQRVVEAAGTRAGKRIAAKAG